MSFAFVGLFFCRLVPYSSLGVLTGGKPHCGKLLRSARWAPLPACRKGRSGDRSMQRSRRYCRLRAGRFMFIVLEELYKTNNRVNILINTKPHCLSASSVNIWSIFVVNHLLCSLWRATKRTLFTTRNLFKFLDVLLDNQTFVLL